MDILNVRGDARFYDIQQTLDGVTYTFVFRWNTRLSAWFMTVYDETGQTVLVGSTRIVLGALLGGGVLAKAVDTGLLFARDTSGQQAEIQFMEEFGVRVQLLYVSYAEINAGRA